MFRFFFLFTLSLSSFVLFGCNPAPTPITKKAPSPAEHAHGAGPHGGVLADWGGGKYHVEFTVDHDKKESVVYIIGSDEKSPAPVKADKLLLTINDPAFQLELKAQPLEGESNGMSSRFVGQHDNLGKVQEFAGTITGEVEGTPYAADFKEEPSPMEKR
jgi:hypothetical protein